MTSSETAALLSAVEAHFIAPGLGVKGGTFLREVQDPADGNRRADAVYMGFTQSRGWSIDVIEVKVSTADYRKELADPTKAEAWWPYSTRFWIASPSPLITPPSELPPGWGLMCPKKRGRLFQTHVEPAVREPQVTLPLLITIAKKLDLSAVYWRTQAEIQSQKVDRMQQTIDRLYAERDQVRDPRTEHLRELEKAAGVELSAWSGQYRASPERLGTAVRLALAGIAGHEDADRRLRLAERAVQSVGRDIDAALATLKFALADVEQIAAGRSDNPSTEN